MTDIDRQLTAEEVRSRGLPAGDCCCPSHGHDWYERTHDGQTWIECRFCSDQP